VLGLALGLAGVVLLAAPWYDGSRAVSLTGVLAALGAAACYGGSYVYARLLLTNRGIEPLVLAAAQLTIGAVDWASADHAEQQCCPQRGRAGRASTGIAYVLNSDEREVANDTLKLSEDGARGRERI
jgi:hypothetical protein